MEVYVHICNCFKIYIIFLQNANELEHDASSIIKLLATTGTEFSGVASKLDACDHSTIIEWVTEALDLVYLEKEAPNTMNVGSGDDHGETPTASNGACMVIALLTQWLVRYMIKKLMQLMTPEALILNRRYALDYISVYMHVIHFFRNIPISYLETYLNYQTHFSFSGLITNHIQMIDQW